MRLGDTLLQARQRAGRTLAYLAEATGYSVGYLSDIERGKRIPAMPALESLAASLGLEGERRTAIVRLARDEVCRAAVRRWERGAMQ